jgi:formylglycine-generating enzyme required for sulfatase activity
MLSAAGNPGGSMTLPLSHLSPLELATVASLLATALLALIATNTRNAKLARRAIGLSCVAASGAVIALALTSSTATSGATAPYVQTLLVPSFASKTGHGDIVRDCDQCPAVVVIPAGWFTMGAGPDDADARPQELPARSMRITREIAIGQTEVTVGQFEAFLLASGHPVPACWAANAGGRNAAATCVSWHDAAAYLRWLTALTGRNYRLPTAAEWEYAARAGSGLAYPLAATGDQQRPPGVSAANATDAAVAKGAANYFGLYDVNGGVAELTQDCWSDTLAPVPGDGSALASGADGSCSGYVVKDGSWAEVPERARYSARRSIRADKAMIGVGFRVARELSPLHN